MRKITIGTIALCLFTIPSGAQAVPTTYEGYAAYQTLTTTVDAPQLVLEEIPVKEGPSFTDTFMNAATAQVGVRQDCTDLVQNSLAAIGLTTRRDAGGPDYGVRQFSQFGTHINSAQAMPGDIVITGPDNGGHVWILIDPATNLGVHGGWGNLQTVVTASYTNYTLLEVYRVTPPSGY